MAISRRRAPAHSSASAARDGPARDRSLLVSTLGEPGRRSVEMSLSRRGTQECVRHGLVYEVIFALVLN
jgi:hypothetical protein